ncbi:MAG: rhodanese-like domain-containing protein [Bacteroidetes bacterium]|nr:MAG: rhodanese-like domain-containing protein [Bacteroidota bacterium]
MDITVQELKKKLADKEDFVFIDVREPWEYEEFNLGARLVPLNDLLQNLDQLDASKNDEIVVHCRSGQRSGMAKMYMEAAGFSNVRNLLGGVIAWQEAFGQDAKP